MAEWRPIECLFTCFIAQPDGRLEIMDGPPPLEAILPAAAPEERQGGQRSGTNIDGEAAAACDVDADGWQVGSDGWFSDDVRCC